MKESGNVATAFGPTKLEILGMILFITNTTLLAVEVST